MAVTPNGVTVRDIAILKVAAGQERVDWWGTILDLLTSFFPSSFNDDVALEVRRANAVLARRTFRDGTAADEVRERLARRLRAMSDDEWSGVADWQPVLDSL